MCVTGAPWLPDTGSRGQGDTGGVIPSAHPGDRWDSRMQCWHPRSRWMV